MNIEGCFQVLIKTNGKYILYPEVSGTPYITSFVEIMRTFQPYYICFTGYMDEYDDKGKVFRRVALYKLFDYNFNIKTMKLSKTRIVDPWAADKKSIYKLIRKDILREVKDEAEIAKLMLAGECR